MKRILLFCSRDCCWRRLSDAAAPPNGPLRPACGPGHRRHHPGRDQSVESRVAAAGHCPVHPRPGRPRGDRDSGHSHLPRRHQCRPGRQALLLFVAGDGCLGPDAGGNPRPAAKGTGEIPHRPAAHGHAARGLQQTRLVAWPPEQPGVYPMAAPMSLLEAIALAGGTASSGTEVTLQDLADLRHSFVMRQGQFLPVDFYASLEGRGHFPKHLPAARRLRLCAFRIGAASLCDGRRQMLRAPCLTRTG